MNTEQTYRHSLLSRFSGFLAQQIGLYFPQQRWPDLVRGIEAAAREFDFHNTEECMRWLMSTSWAWWSGMRMHLLWLRARCAAF